MSIAPTGVCRDCSRRAIPGSRYCADHQVSNNASEHKRTFDLYRDNNDPIRKLYKTPRWRATRRIVLDRDILCASCGHKAATIIDHILNAHLIVSNFGVDEFYNPDRLQGLCKSCHDSKTAIEVGFAGRKGTKLTEFGDRSNLTIVCGQPGSGKTTYVSNHKAANDLVWDFDVFMAELTGLPLHRSMPGAVGSVLAVRDQWIEATRYSKQHCWLIVSNPKAVIVEALQDAGAEVIVMDTPDEECQRRLRARFIAENTPANTAT